jgi:hypothetical protein
MNEDEWNAFKQNNPSIAKYFEDPPAEVLNDLPIKPYNENS